MQVLAVAALSARVLAEAAADDGHEVIALDLFGDADTRRACAQWLAIGAPVGLRIDADLLLSHLAALARRGDVAGWIAGSGFDGRPDLLARGAALLPLIGTPADSVRRVRDPEAFFAHLSASGIAHPPMQMTAPADATGWLQKDAHGCGGWHIRRAGAVLTAEGVDAAGRRYFQREVPGTPMSATFIANGRDARVLGFNAMMVQAFGARPFVFCGVVGPVPLPAPVASRIIAAVRALAAAFDLRGLGSLDFMLDGDSFSVLEINPRPPASMVLYGERCGRTVPQGPGRGVVAAHVRACRESLLPQANAQPVGAAGTNPVHGAEIVFARRPVQLDEATARRLAARFGCHDLPAVATRFDTGDPVCSVSASGAGAALVRLQLAANRDAVHQSLEFSP